MLSPYDNKTAQIRSKLFPHTNWVRNKFYRLENDAYVFCNQRGYIHILVPERVKLNDKTLFVVIDYMLAPDGSLKNKGAWSDYYDCINSFLEYYNALTD